MTPSSISEVKFSAGQNVLSVKKLIKDFPIRKGIIIDHVVANVRAVADVSFDLKSGETLGLVGESGCGKSTLGRCILRLLEPTSGEVRFHERNILDLPANEMRRLRQHLQFVQRT